MNNKEKTIAACLFICFVIAFLFWGCFGFSFSTGSHDFTAFNPMGFPVLFGEYLISTELNELSVTFTSDGNTVYFATEDWLYGSGGKDIWESYFNGIVWSEPKLLPFTTPFDEFAPTLSHDDMHLYFCSNRPGGFGDNDIWIVDYSENGWGEPRNAGMSINSAGNESGVSISSGETMVFATDGRGGNGGLDLFLSQWDGKTWTLAQPLSYYINSPYDEFDPLLGKSGDDLIFATDRPGGIGEVDLWISFAYQNYWIRPRNMGEIYNSKGFDRSPFLSGDGKTFYFTSYNRRFDGTGGFDIWKIPVF